MQTWGNKFVKKELSNKNSTFVFVRETEREKKIGNYLKCLFSLLIDKKKL